MKAKTTLEKAAQLHTLAAEHYTQMLWITNSRLGWTEKGDKMWNRHRMLAAIAHDEAAMIEEYYGLVL